MWTVTTSDGREYSYESFESAVLAARVRFSGVGYKITNTEGDVVVTWAVRDKERHL